MLYGSLFVAVFARNNGPRFFVFLNTSDLKIKIKNGEDGVAPHFSSTPLSRGICDGIFLHLLLITLRKFEQI